MSTHTDELSLKLYDRLVTAEQAALTARSEGIYLETVLGEATKNNKALYAIVEAVRDLPWIRDTAQLDFNGKTVVSATTTTLRRALQDLDQ